MSTGNPYLDQLYGTPKQEPSPSTGGNIWLVLFLVLFGFLAYTRYQDKEWPFDQRDEQGQIDDEKKEDGKKEEDKKEDKKEDKISYEGATLVLVLDSETTAEEQLIVNLVQPQATGEQSPLLSKYKLNGFRRWDDDQPAASLYKGNRPAPAVYLYKGGIIKSAPFPKTEQELEDFIKWTN